MLSKMKKSKSPCFNSLPCELFKIMSDTVSHDHFKIAQEVIKEGRNSKFFHQGLIKFIQKNAPKESIY